MRFQIDIMGQMISFEGDRALLNFREISGCEAISWPHAPVHIGFKLRGYDLWATIITSPDAPEIYINSDLAAAGNYRLGAGDRVLIPGLEVMMVISGRGWEKALHKRQQRKTSRYKGLEDSA